LRRTPRASGGGGSAAPAVAEVATEVAGSTAAEALEGLEQDAGANATAVEDASGASMQEETWDQVGTAMLALALAGALDTGYVTAVKLGTTKLACPISEGACSAVLNSPWAMVGPVPLAALGFLAYVAVGALVVGKGRKWPESQEIYALVFAMALTSLGLMGILIGVLKTPCTFCAVSAFASAGLLALTETCRARMEAAEPAPPSAQADVSRGSARLPILLLAAAVAAGALRGGTMPVPASEDSFMGLIEKYKPEHPPLRSESSQAEKALAAHLTSIGAACYTAWWCPHCQEQRENFGKEAVELGPFVQCAGMDQRMLPFCKEKDIKGYPTWVIGDKQFSGARDLSELANMSNFTTFPLSSFKRRPKKAVAYIWGEPDEEDALNVDL